MSDDDRAGVEHERARAAALTRAVAPVRPRLSTPALVIDLDAVEHNIAAMIRRLGHDAPRDEPAASRWRPHVKTVKQPTIVGLLLDAGVHRFKAATPAEVALVLQAAADRALPRPVDVLLAYPAAPPQLCAMLELRRAHPHARLGLLADAPAHARELVAGIGTPDHLPAFDLWLDVDVGMHRTGSAAAAWYEGSVAQSPWLRLVGLHGYEGHLGFAEREAAFEGYDALCELARALAEAPSAAPEDAPAIAQICTSGTHGYAHALAHPGLRHGPWSSQVGPGTLVLSDRRSADAAADLGLRQAAFVGTRVVARPCDDRITLDAGSKALCPDCPAPACGVLGQPSWVPLPASEEHRPVHVGHGPRPERGTLVWLVPDHVCTTVNLHAEALYVRTDTLVGSAPVLARGHRPFLALAALLAGLAGPGTGCEAITTEVPVDLILPPDDPALARTNNVSIVLEPQGFARTVATDGLDFALSFEVPPDSVIRTLAIYLAEDDELLAWGRTPAFTYAGASQGLAVLLARPGALTPLDFALAQPDPTALAAPVAGVGALVLARDGSALFLDAYQYRLQAASTLVDPPAPDDGLLVGAADGGVVRVAWRDGLAVWRFDAALDRWQVIELGGDRQARPGAAAWLDSEGDRLRIFGGGSTTHVIELPLLGGEARDVSVAAHLRLDAPRAGAAVIVLDGHPLVIGGDDPALPVAWQADGDHAAGPTAAWTALACAPLLQAPPQALCVGGLRDGTATADALRLTVQGGTLDAEVLPSLLPAPLSAPLLFTDADALYVQGEGRFFRIDRNDLAIAEPAATIPRATGGSTTPLPSGATLIVGGRDPNGDPLERWYAFAPAVEP
jgi:D-serine deaminase-like pyridoxal phosphate-dependent protein